MDGVKVLLPRHPQALIMKAWLAYFAAVGSSIREHNVSGCGLIAWGNTHAQLHNNGIVGPATKRGDSPGI
jgi:hypothetical protein